MDKLCNNSTYISVWNKWIEVIQSNQFKVKKLIHWRLSLKNSTPLYLTVLVWRRGWSRTLPVRRAGPPWVRDSRWTLIAMSLTSGELHPLNHPSSSPRTCSLITFSILMVSNFSSLIIYCINQILFLWLYFSNLSKINWFLVTHIHDQDEDYLGKNNAARNIHAKTLWKISGTQI